MTEKKANVTNTQKHENRNTFGFPCSNRMVYGYICE